MTTEQRYLFYSANDMHCARTIGPHALCITRDTWSAESDAEAEERGWFKWEPRQHSTAICGLRIYRDDLRGGWHCVPEGVRYVAVKGWPAGARHCGYFLGGEAHAQRAAALWNAPGYVYDGSTDVIRHHDASEGNWCVLDLHDLAAHRQASVCEWNERDHRNVVVCSCPGLSRREVSIAAMEGAGWEQIADGIGGRCAEGLRAWGRLNAPHLSGIRAPRFRVVPASEMRQGEPCIQSGIPNGWTEHMARGRADSWCESLNQGDPQIGLMREGWNPRPRGYVPLWGIIDTHSPEWQAFDAKHRKGAGIKTVNEALQAGTLKYPEPKSEHVGSPQSDAVDAMLHAWKGIESYTSPRTQAAKARTKAIKGERYESVHTDELADHVLPDIAYPHAKPQWPSDAEIAEAWSAYQRKEWGDFHKALGAPRIKVGEYSVTMDECRAAWSRELKRKQAEAREAERSRVVCEGTLECDY